MCPDKTEGFYYENEGKQIAVFATEQIEKEHGK